MGIGTFTLKIDTLAYKGKGVGRRDDGKVVFVPMVLPGEYVRVHTIKEHASYCEAELDEIITDSPARVRPVCPIFSICGGCDWQHIAYPAQIAWKQEILFREVCKPCKEHGMFLLRSVSSGEVYGYRCHARIQCSYDPEFTLGFFLKRSHTIVNFETCPMLKRRLQDIFPRIRAYLKRYPGRVIQALELYAPEDEVFLLIHVRRSATKEDVLPFLPLMQILDIAGIVIIKPGPMGWRHAWGRDRFTYHVHAQGKLFCLFGDVGGFIQANIGINDAMVEHVLACAQGSQRVLELYSGCGNFSIPLGHIAEEVIAVERDPRLATLGRENAKANDLFNIKFIHSDVCTALESYLTGGFDTVVLDPPREGVKDLAQLLFRFKPTRILYVSCNPTTLARDLSPLRSHGFSLASLRFFDMFPQTYHIEAIACLER